MSAMADELDEALVASVLARERGADVRLFRAIEPVVLGVAYRFVPVQDVEEMKSLAFQHIWNRNWRVLRTWDRTGSLRGYLRAVIRNLCVDHVRRRHPQLVPLTDDHDFDERFRDERPSANPDAGYHAAQLRKCFGLALDRLTNLNREVIKLRHFDGCTHQEIADRLEKTLGYVGPTLARAEKQLMSLFRVVCPGHYAEILRGERWSGDNEASSGERHGT